MGAHKKLSEVLKNIVRQISGKLEDFEGALYSEYMIIGSGIIYCLSRKKVDTHVKSPYTVDVSRIFMSDHPTTRQFSCTKPVVTDMNASHPSSLLGKHLCSQL